MKVFKFGGASVNGVEKIQQAAEIIRSYQPEKLIIVVSAIGKTTNALEKVAESFYAGNKDEALQLFNAVKQNHLNIAKFLLVTHYNETFNRLSDFFTEVEWLLHDRPVRNFDYYYDQVVCIGELLSSCLFSAWLNETHIANKWLDVRDILRTDDSFRDAVVDWEYTRAKVGDIVLPLLETVGIVVTQGFIGATQENESTSLGREGSDYTAAVFANMINASDLTIWKDVEGVMNADPKVFPDAQVLPELNYDEVIEMAYYGAQVIHPKTIKPLQNKNIPLLVKSFLDSNAPGTVIHNRMRPALPPIIVIKKAQVLMHLHSKDFSFVGEKLISRLYDLFGEYKIEPRLIQTGAVSVLICMDDRDDKIQKLALAAADDFEVQVEKNLSLLTIRHFTGHILQQLTSGKTVVLKQQSPETVQVLMR
ncbi:MAG: aspartate kinase [Chitinophagaceae bacterium]|nr:MAG: aspartate kinase [Chitinophagaceae bacterium]